MSSSSSSSSVRVLSVAVQLNQRGVSSFDSQNAATLRAASVHFRSALKLLKRAILVSRKSSSSSASSSRMQCSSSSSSGSVSSGTASPSSSAPHIIAPQGQSSSTFSPRSAGQQPRRTEAVVIVEDDLATTTDTSSPLYLCATPIALERPIDILDGSTSDEHQQVVSWSRVACIIVTFNLALTTHLLSHLSTTTATTTDQQAQQQQQNYRESALGLYQIALNLRSKSRHPLRTTSSSSSDGASSSSSLQHEEEEQNAGPRSCCFLLLLQQFDLSILNNVAVLYLEVGNRKRARSCFDRLEQQIRATPPRLLQMDGFVRNLRAFKDSSSSRSTDCSRPAAAA